MTYARKSLIALQDTPYYHVVSRCVRRARLWGFDRYAGRDYSHRKQWILDRLAKLTGIFAIDVCAYAVMSDHYHLVLHVDSKRVHTWTSDEVVDRWEQLFSVPPLIQRWRDNIASPAECNVVEQLVQRWRQRLHDISWFMRCLNEYLARRANQEDDCSGRFWEGRFRSQALLDEAGLLTAMAYVDLNPIRAGIAATPEDSDFTSISARLQGLRKKRDKRDATSTRPVPLMRFNQDACADGTVIPFTLSEYATLVDWSGRARRHDKPGAIDGTLPPILARLNIDPEAWHRTMQPRGNAFGRALGKLGHLKIHAQTLGQHWIRGLRQSERMYGCG
jgi:REP element-mobilizing transposase RayT